VKHRGLSSVEEVSTTLVFSVHFFFTGNLGLQLIDNNKIRGEYGKRVKKIACWVRVCML